MKRCPVPGLFNARLRGQIIRTIARCGEYRGHKGTQEFAIYRGQEGVILLLEQGKRWRALPAINVFDACETIEALERKSRYASYDSAAETTERPEDGGTGCSDSSGTGRQAAAEPAPAEKPRAPQKRKAKAA